MKVLFVTAEAYPFAKTGGLGDVGGSLPAALAKQKIEVRVMLPQYASIPQIFYQRIRPITHFVVELGWRRLYCGLGHMAYQGVDYYFIDNEFYFRRDRLYGYEDEGERFAYFSKAVLESLTRLNFRPDLLHCHDWHTALIPLFLQEHYQNHPYYFGMKTLLTIHNLKHQGWFDPRLMEDVVGLGHSASAWEKIEMSGGINYLKAGLLTAHVLTTVSPTYAREIQNPYFGEQLDGVLRKRKKDLYGILNGIDGQKYDPRADPHLAVPYETMEQKQENKTRLQSLLHLPVRKELPLLAMVSRLDGQKGLDLLAHVLDEILDMDLQLVVLGRGEPQYQQMFEYFVRRYPEKMAARFHFDEGLAHKIYGGADLLLMPSRYEPCGLSQMIAMRYGTIPLVRETGGLKDSVSPYNQYTGEGNGFSFANYNAHELLFTVQRAVRLFYEHPAAWKALVKNARKADFTWDRSAAKYRRLYEKMLQGKD